MHKIYELLLECHKKFKGTDIKVESLNKYGDNKVELTCSSSHYMLSLAITQKNVMDAFVLKIDGTEMLRNVTEEYDSEKQLYERITEYINDFIDLVSTK